MRPATSFPTATLTRTIPLLLALVLAGAGLPKLAEAQDACANCDEETQTTKVHRFCQDCVFSVTQGTGFHSSWEEGSCSGAFNNPHGHKSCMEEEEEEEQQDDLQALREAIVTGDVVGVEMLVMRSPFIRWSLDNDLIVKVCEGTEVEMAIEWLSATPLYIVSRPVDIGV